VIDSIESDWAREQLRPGEWNPGKRLLCCIRDYQRYHQEQVLLRGLRSAWAVLRHRLWRAVSGADISVNCQIGGGLLLPHPNGLVIHPDTREGSNCLIFQQVTLRTLTSGGTPVIGGHVRIGASPKLLGGIVIGDQVKMGANAVVLTDVPAGAVAVGAPARRLPVSREAVSHE